MRATLDSYRLEVESGVSWALVPGVAPAAIQIEIDREGAEALLEDEGAGVRAKIGGSTLTIDDGVNVQTFEKLTLLSTSPTANPGTLLITVVDNRYTWPYRFVARRYNVRRKSPHRTRVSDSAGTSAESNRADAQTQSTGVAARITYANWSLNNGKVWTSEDIAKDVLDIVIGTGNWEEDESEPIGLNTVPVEGWEFNLQGDAAIAKLWSYMGGGIDCYVNQAGKTIVYQTHDQAEVLELGFKEANENKILALSPLVGSGFVARQNRRRERPQRVRVLFERQVEIRFDVQEGEEKAGDERLRAVNVIPMPEDGTLGDRKLIEGTWVTFDTFLAFCAANPAGSLYAAKLPLTKARIQVAWLSPALFAYASNELDRGGVWRKRIGYVLEHYRRTYQINEFWRDRIRHIFPNLVSVEDPTTGSRAPSPVYQDYCMIHSWKPQALKEDVTDKEVYKLVQNQYANSRADPNTGGDIIKTQTFDLIPAPATLRVIDQDLGVVQWSLATDFTGLADRYIRSACKDREGGYADFKEDKILIQETSLQPGFEASFVVTCAMGAPNDKRRFYAVDVFQSDLKFVDDTKNPRFRGAAGKGTGEGPMLELRVGLPRAVARFAWIDTVASEGGEINTVSPILDRFKGKVPENEDAGSPITPIGVSDVPLNDAECWRIAKAFAEREFTRFEDHYEGTLTTTYRPFARIRGNMSRITHDLAPGDQGGATTTVELNPSLPGLDVLALMPPDVRRVIEGFVEPQ